MKLKMLATVMAGLAASGPAMAQIQTYYHVAAWDAFSGRNERAAAVCGIGNTNPVDNRRISIRREIGGADTMIQVSKPNWSIPEGTRITVVMQIGLNPPWTEQAIGHGTMIDWPMDQTRMPSFDQQFRASSSLTLTFPEGSEPPWSVPLTGSSAISDAFGRCVRDLTRQVQAAGVAPPPAAGPTQPFSPPPGPAPAPPDASPPAATQPGATQPNR